MCVSFDSNLHTTIFQQKIHTNLRKIARLFLVINLLLKIRVNLTTNNLFIIKKNRNFSLKMHLIEDGGGRIFIRKI